MPYITTRGRTPGCEVTWGAILLRDLALCLEVGIAWEGRLLSKFHFCSHETGGLIRVIRH